MIFRRFSTRSLRSWWLHIAFMGMIVLVLPVQAEIRTGMTRVEVIAELGPPHMEYTRNGLKILAYQGLELDLKDGVVVRVPERFEQTVSVRQARREAEAKAHAQAAAKKAKAKFRARMPWARARSVPVAQHRNTGSVKVISNGGRPVNLGSLVSRGKVTIVDFYADWCGPCRQIGPMLERLAHSDPNVNLVKVDINKWKTPVAKQYNISSIPNMRVYDRQGKLVGKPTSSYGDVVTYVKKAKS